MSRERELALTRLVLNLFLATYASILLARELEALRRRNNDPLRVTQYDERTTHVKQTVFQGHVNQQRDGSWKDSCELEFRMQSRILRFAKTTCKVPYTQTAETGANTTWRKSAEEDK